MLIKKICKSILGNLNKISNNRLGSTVLYIIRTKQIPHYNNPRNFNDKTMNLKFSYNDNDLISNCTDKLEVRKYVKNMGCGEILNELYGVFENPEEIDFKKLPNKFVLKCTHGCAYNVICLDKESLNIEKLKLKLYKWLKEKYGYATGELHYTKIKPRIICEKYLCSDDKKMLLDYKIYCFDGKAKYILVCSEREKKLKLSYYDLNWNRIYYEKNKWSSKNNIEKPENLEKMIQYAEKLSKGFKFVRVDLYNEKGKIIFGELTFTPACCCAPYYNNFGNKELGKNLNIE